MNNNINKTTIFRHLGYMDYKEAWDYQENLFNEIVDIKIKNRSLSAEDQEQTKNYLLFCQHPHVYTLGKSGKEEHLLLNETLLGKIDASFYKINRGGDITYHGPGQIVGYPLLDLENFFTDIHKYLRLLEEAVILTLAEYGLNAGRIDGLTGVWLDYEEKINPRKICALGVKTSRWITMHGFALNVNTDVGYFNHIVPCGIQDKAVTTLELEFGRKVEIEEVESKLKHHLTGLFEMHIVVE